MLRELTRSQSLPTFELLPSTVAAGPPRPAAECTGVARVVLQSAELESQGRFSRLFPPNPFVRVRMANHEAVDVGRTEWAQKTYHPNWKFQSYHVLLRPGQERLELDVLSRHSCWWPTLLGTTTFALEPGDDDEPKNWSVQGQLVKGDSPRSRGYLFYNVFYYPVVSQEYEGASPGIVKAVLHEARDLQCSRPVVATVSLGWHQRPLHVTTPATGEEGISWNSAFEFLCTERQNTMIVVKLYAVGWRRSLLGSISSPLDDLLERGAEENWLSMVGHQSAQMRLSVEWRHLRIPKSMAIGSDT